MVCSSRGVILMFFRAGGERLKRVACPAFDELADGLIANTELADDAGGGYCPSILLNKASLSRALVVL